MPRKDACGERRACLTRSARVFGQAFQRGVSFCLCSQAYGQAEGPADVVRILVLQVSDKFPCLTGFVWFDPSWAGGVLYVGVKRKA